MSVEIHDIRIENFDASYYDEDGNHVEKYDPAIWFTYLADNERYPTLEWLTDEGDLVDRAGSNFIPNATGLTQVQIDDVIENLKHFLRNRRLEKAAFNVAWINNQNGIFKGMLDGHQGISRGEIEQAVREFSVELIDQCADEEERKGIREGKIEVREVDGDYRESFAVAA